MSPRSAALVPTLAASHGAPVPARQSALVGDPVSQVRDAALGVGAPGWTPAHHATAQQREVEALGGTIRFTPTAEPETATPVVAVSPSSPTPPPGAPTAAESASVDALFDQAARINVVLLALALVGVAVALVVVLTHL